MESFFDGQTFSTWLQATLAWLRGEIFTPINVIYIAMQIPSIVAAGFGAWWVHDFLHPLLEERIASSSATDYTKRVLLALVALIFPLLWALGLWIASSVALYYGWPHNLARIAINLLAAWIVIRLASIAVRDPLWSRAIVIVAYTIAVLNILHLLGPAVALLDNLAIKAGTLRISMLDVIQGVLSLGVLLWVAVLISGIFERRIQRLPHITPSIQVLIGKLFKVTLVSVAVIVSLASIGIDLTAIALFSGAIGVGIGFGLQKIVSNLISGVILLLDKSIKPGDIIQIGDTYGWVASLGARYVSIETRDSTEFLIPNEDIITKQVLNWTHQNDLVRLKAKVRVPYKADVDKALKLMVQAAERPARVLKQPEPRALVLSFGESAIELELRFWIMDVKNGIRNVSSEVMLEIWRLFQQHDLPIPVAQRDVHVDMLSPLTIITQTDASRQPAEPPGSPMPAQAVR